MGWSAKITSEAVARWRRPSRLPIRRTESGRARQRRAAWLPAVARVRVPLECVAGGQSMEVSGTAISDPGVNNTVIAEAVLGNAGDALAPGEYRDAICFKAEIAATDHPASLTYFGGRPCL